MILTEEQRGTAAFDLEKARAVDIDLLAATDWGELRARYRAALAEIERLRADNAGLSKAVISIQEERDLAQAEFRAYHKAWEEQAARVQELEEVLVEMVATNPCNIPTLCDMVHDELMCPLLDGNCDFWKGCPQKNELRKAARKQLQAEGKIGPDADAKPHCWQITEERKEAIRDAEIALRDAVLDSNDPHCWDAETAVLRAMLEEAE